MMVVTLAQQQYNVGEKPIVILSVHLNEKSERVLVAPEKTTLHGGSQSRSWSAEQGNIYRSVYARKGEKITLFLSFAPENVISRDRSGGPVPRQPVAHSPHSRLNVVLSYEVPPCTVLLVRRACPCCSRITCLRTGELYNSFLWLLWHCCCILYH